MQNIHKDTFFLRDQLKTNILFKQTWFVDKII